jgi:hypothetical protein
MAEHAHIHHRLTAAFPDRRGAVARAFWQRGGGVEPAAHGRGAGGQGEEAGGGQQRGTEHGTSPAMAPGAALD